MEHLNRITQQPDVMGGKACIRGMRVTVGMLVGQIGAGHSIEDVLADYPYLDAKTSCRRFGMPHGAPKNARSCCPTHETSRRHEPVATLDSDAGGFRLRGGALVSDWRDECAGLRDHGRRQNEQLRGADSRSGFRRDPRRDSGRETQCGTNPR